MTICSTHMTIHIGIYTYYNYARWPFPQQYIMCTCMCVYIQDDHFLNSISYVHACVYMYKMTMSSTVYCVNMYVRICTIWPFPQQYIMLYMHVHVCTRWPFPQQYIMCTCMCMYVQDNHFLNSILCVHVCAYMYKMTISSTVYYVYMHVHMGIIITQDDHFLNSIWLYAYMNIYIYIYKYAYMYIYIYINIIIAQDDHFLNSIWVYI